MAPKVVPAFSSMWNGLLDLVSTRVMAGMGATIALLNVPARREIDAAVVDIEKIETAVEPEFPDYFVNAMAIPNKRDAFPRLFSVVDKPAAQPDSSGTGRRRRKKAM